MPVSPGYHSFVVEQLESFLSITSKKMFGGVGLYADEFFFAVISKDRLYFKVDDTNRPDYEAAGMGPFIPYGDKESKNYSEVPVDVLEDLDLLKVWAEKSIHIAKQSKKKK